MNLTPEQRKALEKLWFIFGNNGKMHTWGNHKFIQGILERGEDDREFFKRIPKRQGAPDWKGVTLECEVAVDAILANEQLS